MAIVARSSRVSRTVGAALRGAVEAVETAASGRKSLFPKRNIFSCRSEQAQEIAAVAVCDLVAQLPADALSNESPGEHTLVQVIPVMTVRETSGPVCFSIAAIKHECPQLFRQGYRDDPEAVIQMPVEQVFLGYPRRPQPFTMPTEPTFSTATSLT